ncbi:MAG TPA: DoxX family protein [Micropepsaceae bacterium]|nr:DoxX family protein [Micropepsaceae bacterium]
MAVAETMTPVVGRLTMAAFFLVPAWLKITDFSDTAELIAGKGVPAAPFMLVIAILVEAVAGFMLALGYKTRMAALTLFAYVVVINIVMHDYWEVRDRLDAAYELQLFVKNLAIAGALLLLAGLGPGPLSLDERGGKR